MRTDSQWGWLLIAMSFLVSACSSKSEEDPFGRTLVTLDVPYRFPEVIIPQDNPLTAEGIELGRRLFYDPILSGDNSQSCSTCHQQANAFTDPRPFSVGIDGTIGDRNAMPIINAAWSGSQFWDGRAASLEQQAIEPVINPIEMHEDWNNAVRELSEDPVYPSLFKEAFGSERITPSLAANAIAQFERTLVSADSRYDRFIRGDEDLTESELNGRVMFFTEKGDCFHCHAGILFTDNLFHNNGLDEISVDPGLESVTGIAGDRGKFKTPTLRNISLTAPYMHDSRFNTLEEVVDFYSEDLKNSESVDALMKNVHKGGVGLSDSEKRDLIAFLETLTDNGFVQNPEFQNPFD